MSHNHEVNEFRAAAFEVLLHNPGCDLNSWMNILLREYTEEVVAVLGSDPEEVIDELNYLWNDERYVDENTGIAKTYRQWSKLLSSKDAVDHYRQLVKEANKAKGIE